MRGKLGPVLVVTVSIVVMSTLAAACGPSGSGNIVADTRQLDGFTSVDVRSGLRLEVVVDSDQSHSVTVNYDDNLIDRIVTRIDGDRLVVDIDGAIELSGEGRSVAVVMPTLAVVEASGGATVNLDGRVDSFSIKASGGARVDAFSLRASVVDVTASGGARLAVFANDAVTGDASGGSTVDVFGGLVDVSVETSGGARVSSDGG